VNLYSKRQTIMCILADRVKYCKIAKHPNMSNLLFVLQRQNDAWHTAVG
jgi:hypothetical protein